MAYAPKFGQTASFLWPLINILAASREPGSEREMEKEEATVAKPSFRADVSRQWLDEKDTDQLFRRVYEMLKDLARRMMAAESAGHTLQPTALVHEAYLRLAKDPEARWQNRRHFYGAASRAMRRILVDRARRSTRKKRGGKMQRIPLRDSDLLTEDRAPELLALDEAIDLLERHSPRKAEIVKLKYFAGLKLEETAKLLRLSLATVKLDWSYSRAWLHREIQNLRS